MYRYLIMYLALPMIILASCQSKTQNKKQTSNSEPNIASGKYLGTIINQNGAEVPFFIRLSENLQTITLINGKDEVILDEINYKDDSIEVILLNYDGKLIFKPEDNTLNGRYVKADYQLPFTAKKGESLDRFEGMNETPARNITGKWQTTFISPEGKKTEAIGILDQIGNKITGSFLTPSGDYRFLEGVVSGNKVMLSTFDGGFLYLFTAEIINDELTNGKFHSGKSYLATWSATANENAKIKDLSMETYLKEGFEKISFSFPNLDSKTVSLEDEKFKDKVVILQILGSWCPNCLDEMKFLSPYYNENKDKGLEIIGLAFEKAENLESAQKKLNKLKKRFDVNYELLFAGKREKGATAKALPMLSKVVSYPTTIFIDRKGNIRKVHAGFSGPGTGEYYDKYVEEFNDLMNELLNEVSI
ncbi:peroxiredoxin family protein [Aureibacter tunicatorum]|uniref:Thiol-disulfide isomerase/thioredoxin n=1 Tax=Aureibacter tunicatorum TaxID=866807 RepID=A0AAE4BSI1_9BACT|nr:TlpA disulfide reductase family protein [Aureibacter tunicatorum]MDR6238437.1 thiol-disulfide isomerase/thioredoxin [Aureibacter tunicatorum]BDD05629.1 hypothetical protein AUTU_31120 [Aureibacter tunicatorum]